MHDNARAPTDCIPRDVGHIGSEGNLLAGFILIQPERLRDLQMSIRIGDPFSLCQRSLLAGLLRFPKFIAFSIHES